MPRRSMKLELWRSRSGYLQNSCMFRMRTQPLRLSKQQSCGVNTAPGCMNRLQMDQALAANFWNGKVEQSFNSQSEVYYVKPAVWKRWKQA
jgi:hypothetical protein